MFSNILQLESIKRIIAKKTLKDFWKNYADAEQYLKTWYETAKKTQIGTAPNDNKQTFIYASFLKDSRIIFYEIGNSFRLVLKLN